MRGRRTLPSSSPGGQAEAVIAVASDGLRIAGVSAAVAALGWLLWRNRRRALVPALGYVLLFLVRLTVGPAEQPQTRN